MTALTAALTIASELVRRLPSPEVIEARRLGGMVRRARRLSRRAQEARRSRSRRRAADRLAGLTVTIERLMAKEDEA